MVRIAAEVPGPPEQLIRLLCGGGFQLSVSLRAMLNDAPEHLTERRGCGFTQSTRVLAQVLHNDTSRRGGTIKSIFDGPAPKSVTVRDLRARVPRIYALWLTLLADVLARDAKRGVPICSFSERHEVGSCAMAEKYFLEIAHSLRMRKGWVRIYLAQDQPVIIEKVNMGDEFSAMSLVPLLLEGVQLPAGALLAVKHDFGQVPPRAGEPRFRAVPVEQVKAKFLRLTTFVADPIERKAAFGPQLERQIRNGFVRPEQTTLEALYASVHRLLGR